MDSWVKKDLRDFGKYLSNSSDLESLSAEKIDLAFIGAGLSSTFTLIEFIKQIEDKKHILDKESAKEGLNIVIFEKDSWIWGGIPYGRRSGFTSLIITPLDEFLPESELKEFTDWMRDNYNWLIVPFKENHGDRSKQWLKESEGKIKSGNSNRIHIPRYFFGMYIWEKLQKTISQSSKNIKLSFINAEVTSIETDSALKHYNFVICIDKKVCFKSNQVLLGVGIPQIRSLDKKHGQFPGVLYLHDPYDPDLTTSLEKVHKNISKNTSTKVLIVGANASALEMIYQITNLKNFINYDIDFSVIAPQGKLPDLFIKDKETSFVANTLQNLSSSDSKITANSILNALKEDLNFADKNNYDISDTLPTFTKHVGSLVGRLSKNEKFNFISFHGVEIGRLQRRAGQEYTQPVKDLVKEKKLSVIKGKFSKFCNDNGVTTVLLHRDNQADCEKRTFDIVINCAGSSGLSNSNISPLLKQLKDSGICSSTSSNHGFKVGENFDILPGFYINGPLLAGNVIGEMGIWHVEHCGRIINFAKHIANNIINDEKFITYQKSI